MNALVRLNQFTKHSTRLLLNFRHSCNVSSKSESRYNVKPCGLLKVRTGSSCDISVQSIDAQLYPDQNVAYCDGGKVSQFLSSLTVRNSDKGLSINDDTDTRNDDELSKGSQFCAVYVPVRFNLDVAVKGNRNISIEDMHSDSIEARLEQGTCLLNKLQCASVAVHSKSGNIISEGILQGDAVLDTQASGTIKLHKPLCRKLSVRTHDGDIRVTSLYADVSNFSTRSGSVYIGSAHRDVNINIAERGNVVLDSLDGSLTASVKSGNVSVYVSRYNAVNIFIETGNVTLKLSDTLKVNVELVGSEITFDDQLDTSRLKRSKDHALTMMKGVLDGQDDDAASAPVMTENESEIKIKTLNGIIKVFQQDWFSTVKLANSKLSEPNF